MMLSNNIRYCLKKKDGWIEKGADKSKYSIEKGNILYKVSRGDSFGLIAKKHQLTLKELSMLNEGMFSNTTVGSNLVVCSTQSTDNI